MDERRAAARADLASPRFAPLWAAVRRRLEGNGGAVTGSPLVLRGLTPEQADAVAGLVGAVAGPDEVLRLRPDRLDEALRSGAVGMGLVEAAEAIGGPLRDRKADRAADRRTRERVWDEASTHEAVARHPGLIDWLDHVRRRGTATRLADGIDGMGVLVGATLDVLARLPADPVVPLAALADDVTGDPHALDRGRPVGTLAASALTVLGASDPEPVDDDWDPSTVEQRELKRQALAAWDWRRAWADVGVLCDDLSVSALVLNLPIRSSGDIIANAVYEHGLSGEPLRLTLRQVAIAQIEVVSGSVVSVCENPAVVAQAAMALGDDAGGLVCVEGVPNTAVAAVLDLLVEGGATLRYHGDFDWPGVAIADTVIRRWGASPWRMGAEEYRRAAPRARKPLTGAVEEASWDPDLAPAMEEAGVAVHEEQVLADLIEDLTATS